jgi:multiple sugar transport system permease protein
VSAQLAGRPASGALRERRLLLGRPPRETLFALALHAPWMVLLLGLIAWPILSSFWTSLHLVNLRRPNASGFVGLQNYLTVLTSDYFHGALRVTAILTVFSVLGVVLLGLTFGIVLNEAFRGRGVLRALVLLPWAIPGVVNGVMWQWLLDPNFGLVNGLLVWSGLMAEYTSWLLDERTLFAGLIAAHLWNSLPFPVLVTLAGLQAIPEELYDAAQVDGAGLFERFRYITLPWLIHPLLIIIILGTIGGLRIFDIVYVLTSGGPANSSTTIAFAAYRVAFDQLNFGVGNAYAYIIFLMTMTMAVVYIRLLYRRGEIQM